MSDESDENNVLQVAHEIQNYLQDHPNAADTLEGINKWWISRIRVEEAAVVIIKALEILERQGMVEKTVSVDGKEIYSRSTLKTIKQKR
ncbi:MAG: hypothetical protein V3U75_02935 [Methylococcaceae bacterium]